MSSNLANEAGFEKSFAGFFYRQWIARRKPIPLGTTLAGQVAIVTGANAGLGIEVCRQLLRLDTTRLILAVRSLQKGEVAASSLRNEFPAAQIEVWTLDMANYDSITAFVAKCETLEHISLVMLNAGLANGTFTTVASTGHEETFQVNYLSTVLLAVLLLPVLKKKKGLAGSKPATLSIVSSDGAYSAQLKKKGPVMAQFDDATIFSPFESYFSTKLLQILFITKLAQQVSPDHVLINLVNPGFCAPTGLGQGSLGAVMSALSGAWKFFMARNLETGASVLINAAVAQGRESHGSFVSEWTIRPYPGIAYTQDGNDIKERLWEETMEELNFAQASKIVRDLGAL
ncbi:putative short-chain dehydrogenase/reductase family protein [Xylariales sp. AK1849]|nr:putative short-chain dehydrogenase/reductase family protein [Xylariales sp. AK1849]